jgi:hypothetical protein
MPKIQSTQQQKASYIFDLQPEKPNFYIVRGIGVPSLEFPNVVAITLKSSSSDKLDIALINGKVSFLSRQVETFQHQKNLSFQLCL